MQQQKKREKKNTFEIIFVVYQFFLSLNPLRVELRQQSDLFYPSESGHTGHHRETQIAGAASFT